MQYDNNLSFHTLFFKRQFHEGFFFGGGGYISPIKKKLYEIWLD
jgi:hypothetical protein